MTIIQQGTINTTNLTVPDDYIQIVPPNNSFINGQPTNILGLVGIATWGPVNSPTTAGSLAQATSIFGPIQTKKYDLLTHVAVACMQGASNLLCVRVTDGTDVAATVPVVDTAGSPVTGLTATAIYTGTFGNTISVTVGKGASWTSGTPTYRITIVVPNGIPEIFDNIGGTGAAFWTNAVSAINNGQGGTRGPSKLIVATIGSSTAAPALQSYTLSSGTDGTASITSSVLIGSDSVPRQGMYALRNSGASIIDLCDNDDSTTYTTQISYGLSEGAYMIMTGPTGQSISSATSAIQTAGVNSYAGKVLLGDWCNYNDTYNKQLRLISPQGYIAGLLSTLNPSQSSLNKPLLGIVSTQKTAANQTYSAADLQNLALARIDVITLYNNSYTARFGRSCSADPNINEENYTLMTNYLASTFNVSMQQFLGQPQTPSLWTKAKGALNAFLQSLVDQNLIGSVTGGLPFKVTIDATNNSQPRVALGYMQADIQVVYFSIVQYFIVNLQGGASVTIQNAGAQPLVQNI